MLNRVSFGAGATGSIICSNFTIPNVRCKVENAKVSEISLKKPSETNPSEAQPGDILVGSFGQTDDKKDIYCVTSLQGDHYMTTLNLSKLSGAKNPNEISNCTTRNRKSNFNGTRLLKADVSISS